MQKLQRMTRSRPFERRTGKANVERPADQFRGEKEEHQPGGRLWGHRVCELVHDGFLGFVEDAGGTEAMQNREAL